MYKYMHLCIYIHTNAHVCTHTHTISAFKELGICKRGPHGLPMITDPRLYFSFLEDNHSFEAEVLGSISKTGRRSVTMRTDRSGEHGFQN